MSHLSASLFDIQLDLIREHQKQLRTDAALSRLLGATNGHRYALVRALLWLQRLLRLNVWPAGQFSPPVSAN